ncbi:helix-turn-helix domain-containing protein [Devosia sp. Naph2]|uniref:helix-turn-helix domain-containing protein n=1 Tax=Devosia polycyclovorans TaxID=3345148 RepID=UPI0035D0424A
MLHNPLPPFTRFQGAPCPFCGGATLCPSPQRLTQIIELTEHEEAALEFLWDRYGNLDGDGKAANFEIADWIFQDHDDGGPSEWSAGRDVHLAITGLRRKLQGLGYVIKADYRNRPKGKGRQEWRRSLHLTPDPGAPTTQRLQVAGKSGGYRRQFRPVKCRCCGRQIASPTLEQVMSVYGLQPRERQIIRIIDSAIGRVASNEWLLELMFADDPVPKNPDRKYSALKVAISNARKKLRGSGVTIEAIGYGQGFTLVDEVGA